MPRLLCGSVHLRRGVRANASSRQHLVRQDVAGSNPVPRSRRSMASRRVGCASDSQAEGRGFESHFPLPDTYTLRKAGHFAQPLSFQTNDHLLSRQRVCAPPPAFANPGLALAALPDTDGILAPHRSWWAMQGSNLRPSVCKPSEPERCAPQSAPPSENAEVIIWKRW